MDTGLLIHSVLLTIIHENDCLIEGEDLLLFQAMHINSMLLEL